MSKFKKFIVYRGPDSLLGFNNDSEELKPFMAACLINTDMVEVVCPHGSNFCFLYGADQKRIATVYASFEEITGVLCHD